MSTNDYCYLGACCLIEFKWSAASNENVAKSIVLHFKNPTRASSNDRLSQKAVVATESINRNSNRCHLVTRSINRDPLRDKSNCCLIKIAGTLSLEAVDALCSNLRSIMNVWSIKIYLENIQHVTGDWGNVIWEPYTLFRHRPQNWHSPKSWNTMRRQWYKHAFNSSKVPRKEKCFNYTECIRFPYVDHFMLTTPIAVM